ncbi:TadE/TadG family type IV pilus assembly protein [Roseomonas sp. E05]|uniref:TadE/TadG family type IV pilus assembly protein n=1 Tax=Roseomonas sp. E05 TaxID=3046310 RepID=UPI0024BBE606|nr:TadE/TadG family type IV pilus assembly protein [Roseomonas sp. E05]MDJ0391286.1 TadE/TadG family type IV pilus assembly protein [Roseomonas sp. E05]
MPSFACARLGRRGALSLELGLVALPFLMLLLGGIELARYAYTVEAVERHANATLRAALVYVGGDTTNRCLSELSAAIAPPALLPGLAADRMIRNQASCAIDSTSRQITVRVAVAYRFSFIAALFGAVEQEISRTAQQSL